MRPWPPDPNDLFGLELSYDCGFDKKYYNGNIGSLKQRGLEMIDQGSGPKIFGRLDNLRYSYDGNRLLAVDDDALAPAGTPGFQDNGSNYAPLPQGAVIKKLAFYDSTLREWGRRGIKD